MYGASGQQFYHSNIGGGPGQHSGMGISFKPVGVFWDIENCPLPRGKTASSVIHFIRNFFVVNRLNNREYEFLIACDITRLRKDIPEDINRAGGVTLAHVSGMSKNAADEKLRESMKRFVDTHASLAPILILISGDIDFVNDLRGFQTRLGCTIIVLHGASSSPYFKQGWNEVYAFQTFLMMMDTNESDSATPAALEPSASGSNVRYTPDPKKMDRGGGPVVQKLPPQHPNEQRQQPTSQGFTAYKVPPMETQPSAPMLNKAQNKIMEGQVSEANRSSQFAFGNSSVPTGEQSAPPLLTKAQKNAPKVGGKVKQGSNGVPTGVVPSGPPMTKAQKKAVKAAREALQGLPNVQGGVPSGPPLLPKVNKKVFKAAEEANHQTASGAAYPDRQGYPNAIPNFFPLSNGPSTGINNVFPQPPQERPSGAPMTNVAPKAEKQKKKRKGTGIPNANSATLDPKIVEQVVSNLNQMNMNSSSSKSEVILMVSGLPGKMDFRILKEHLQEYASHVSGRVKYVHNGQGFITFGRHEDAERAIKLFQGREVYGKKLNIQLSKSIPFQNPLPKSASASASGGDFVMVDSQPAQPSQFTGMAMAQGSNGPAGSSNNKNFFVEQIGAFATAAMMDALRKQGSADSQGFAGGQKGNKQMEDPNCVIQ